MNLVLNGILRILILFELSWNPETMRKLSTRSAGTLMAPVSPFLLVDFLKDSVLIPLFSHSPRQWWWQKHGALRVRKDLTKEWEERRQGEPEKALWRESCLVIVLVHTEVVKTRISKQRARGRKPKKAGTLKKQIPSQCGLSTGCMKRKSERSEWLSSSRPVHQGPWMPSQRIYALFRKSLLPQDLLMSTSQG